MPETDAYPEIATPRLLILSDGRIGHENQSLGVAAALGDSNPEIVTLRPVLRQRWLHWLPVRVVFGRPLQELLARLTEAQVPPQPRPEMVLGTGFKISRVSRWLKQEVAKRRQKIFTVQLMKASGVPSDYDVVAVPRHSVKGRWSAGASNVIVTVGAPNRITPALMAQEKDRWSGRLQGCPSPRLAVLVGGDSRHGTFSADEAKELMRTVLSWANTNAGSLLVTTSRRTSAPVAALIAHMLEAQKTVPFHFWQPDDSTRRDNPYLAYLAMADAVVATPDSVAMVSEAASAGKPVYLSGDIFRMPKKFQAFYQLLMKQQRLTRWEGKLVLRIPREGLAESAMVAGFVRGKLAGRE